LLILLLVVMVVMMMSRAQAANVMFPITARPHVIQTIICIVVIMQMEVCRLVCLLRWRTCWRIPSHEFRRCRPRTFSN
jgi:hypothetical protein